MDTKNKSMNLIKVKVLSSFLSEKGEKKVGGYSPSKKDKYGYTLEAWEDMNTNIPEDSIHYNSDKDINLDDDDIEIIQSDAYFLAEDFKLVVARKDFGSTVHLKDSITLDVLETPRQIFNKLKLIN